MPKIFNDTFNEETVQGILKIFFKHKNASQHMWDETINLNVILPEFKAATQQDLKIITTPEVITLLKEMYSCLKYTYTLVANNCITTEQFMRAALTLFSLSTTYGQHLDKLGISRRWRYAVMQLITATFNECIYHPDISATECHNYWAFRDEIINNDGNGCTGIEWIWMDVSKPFIK